MFCKYCVNVERLWCEDRENNVITLAYIGRQGGTVPQIIHKGCIQKCRKLKISLISGLISTHSGMLEYHNTDIWHTEIHTQLCDDKQNPVLILVPTSAVKEKPHSLQLFVLNL